MGGQRGSKTSDWQGKRGDGTLMFKTVQTSGLPLAEDYSATERPGQENPNDELPAMPQQTNPSIKTQRDL
jgi:hypothetical protein